MLFLVNTQTKHVFWPYSLAGLFCFVLDVSLLIQLSILSGFFRPSSNSYLSIFVYGDSLQGRGLSDVIRRGVNFLCGLDISGNVAMASPVENPLEEGLLGTDFRKMGSRGP